MTTELWLVRHGQTDWNAIGRFMGHSDQPLNSKGWEQARRLAQQLTGKTFTAIYSSDLQRCFQTAQCLAEKLGLSIFKDRRLREIHQGEWEGKLQIEIVLTHAKLIYEGLRDPLNNAAPGGETVKQVIQRATAAINDIVQSYPIGRVLVVSHGLTLASLICQARDLPFEKIFSYVPEHSEVQVIEWSPVMVMQA